MRRFGCVPRVLKDVALARCFLVKPIECHGRKHASLFDHGREHLNVRLRNTFLELFVARHRALAAAAEL